MAGTDVVDLVSDSDEETRGRPEPSIGKKRGRSVYDTNNSADDTAAAKRRIMAHAARINAAKPPAMRAAELRTARTAGAAGADPAAHAAANDIVELDDEAAPAPSVAHADADADAARSKIMQHAAQVNQNNSWLAQLHAERLQRRGQPDASARASGRPSAGEPASAPAPSTSGHTAAHSDSRGGAGPIQSASHVSGSTANAPSTAWAGRVGDGGGSSSRVAVGEGGSGSGTTPGELTLLTYNVWFAEEVALKKRMAAIGRIIEQKGYPHFICFQEMTPNIYHLMSRAAWWARYTASQPKPPIPYFTILLTRKDVVEIRTPPKFCPFDNSCMGRGIEMVGARLGGCSVRVATSHLESPCGWDRLFSAERVAQARQAVAFLDTAAEGNVIYAGDLNWDDPKDGEFPIMPGWQDAWLAMKAREPGLTYDPKANPMLGPYNRIRKRVDRIYVRLTDWRLDSIEMVGTAAIPGVTYQKQGKKGVTTLPVLPSDHFGLLLRLAPQPT